MRWFPTLLLALLLPVQGLAAACAQICLKAELQHAASAHAGEEAGGHDCHERSTPGDGAQHPDGKCCHAHTFMTEPPLPAAIVDIPSFEPLAFVASWTSFIPEEPSPPPIASAR